MYCKTARIDFNPYSPEEQIASLKQCNIIIKDEKFAAELLRNISFHRFQEYVFLNHNRKNSFDESYKLYVFDKQLRFLIFQCLEHIEVSLRVRWIHIIGGKYKADYLEENYYSSNPKSLETLQRIKNSVQTKAHNTNLADNRLCPIAKASELLSLGDISHLIKNLKHREDRNSLAKTYGMDETIFIPLIQQITLIRNICAHHARLWNKAIKIRVPIPKETGSPTIRVLRTSLHTIESHSSEFNRSSQDKIYNSLCYITYLLSVISPQYLWKPALINLIDSRPLYANLKSMGFPLNWQEKILWQ